MKFAARCAFTVTLSVVLRLAAQTPPPHVWSEEPTGFKGVEFGWTEEQARLKASSTFTFSDSCFEYPPGERQCKAYIHVGELHIHTFFTFDGSAGFAEVTGNFPSEAYQTVRALFVDKYGKPHHADESDVQTNGGGTFKQEDLHWSGPHVDIILSHYGLKVSEGFFKIATATKLAKEKKKAEAELKTALQ